MISSFYFSSVVRKERKVKQQQKGKKKQRCSNEKERMVNEVDFGNLPICLDMERYLVLF